MAVGRIDDHIYTVAPLRPFPQHLPHVAIHIGIVHGRALADAAAHPLCEAVRLRIEQHHHAMFRKEVKFLFRHGVIAPHRDHRFMVVTDAADHLHFLFREGLCPRIAIEVGDLHPRIPLHHAVCVRKLPIQPIGQDLRRSAFTGPHRTDQYDISLLHRYLGFEMQ